MSADENVTILPNMVTIKRFDEKIHGNVATCISHCVMDGTVMAVMLSNSGRRVAIGDRAKFWHWQDHVQCIGAQFSCARR